MRIDYPKIAPKALEALMAPAKYVHGASIAPKLRALVELRVSQINGCGYCCDMHATQARAAGELQQRLDCLAAWTETDLFSEQEQAALLWAETLTRIQEHHVPDEIFNRVRTQFSELEVVDLTVCVAMMNAWNRLAISLRQVPKARTI